MPKYRRLSDFRKKILLKSRIESRDTFYPLFARQECGQTFGHSHLLADDGFYGVLEFGRMGCFKEHTRLAGKKMLFKRMESNSAMRVKQVAGTAVFISDSVADSVVVVCTSAYVGAYSLMRIAVKVEYSIVGIE